MYCTATAMKLIQLKEMEQNMTNKKKKPILQKSSNFSNPESKKSSCFNNAFKSDTYLNTRKLSLSVNELNELFKFELEEDDFPVWQECFSKKTSLI